MDGQESLGAFVTDGLNLAPLGNGVLNGTVFAAKDVFAVRGHVTSAGQPLWASTHPAAEAHAPVVKSLLECGARLRGMTVTDELMYSLKGDNIHYPPTINPRVPDAYSGGSSSGSAVATASEAVDFAIGTDTGGSVRIPSSYCGLFGIRPSHGAVSLEGVVPLAPSFDTVGWMARSAELLERVGSCLLPEKASASFQRFYQLKEAWAQIDHPSVLQSLRAFIKEHLSDLKIEPTQLPLAKPAELAETFRVLQGYEAWQSHGLWIEQNHPHFARDVGGRFEAASKMKKDKAYQQAAATKQQFTEKIRAFLGSDGLLIIPTTYGPAPKRGSGAEESDKVRARTMQLTCIAGVSGLPQVTVPILELAAPIGLSFISGYGTDRQLLAFVRNVFE
ncbi:amidase [Sporolactobacillus inulinus]|uniref:Glutamyl-tRNA amidotransferase n=1 Tax=Sporolactobacillus inulinus CASD TaxID=1069536 RepID=A0A0U1QQL0_9BACL|nr:amidase [Sporolactobacillus inulinus]KLI03097.1 glutamyl-tRNA amidotransferase [Sporolactobacillus inulinus CASD]GEB77275.1 amidase [Sporolactobacillus inulinus]